MKVADLQLKQQKQNTETMKEVASIEQKKNELVMEALNDKAV